jgi:hypothetical protein
MWGIPTEKGALEFTTEMEMDLSTVEALRLRSEAPAGSHRGARVEDKFNELLTAA